MFGVILNNENIFKGFETLDYAKSFALKLGEGMPNFKSIKVVEFKD